MADFTVLHHLYLMLQARRLGLRADQLGATTLETVLWIAGLAVLAIGTIAIVTTKVNTATNAIPTGP